MSETSTTDENNQTGTDAASTDTSTDSTSTDSQTAASDNLDETSKSTDTSDDGDKSTDDIQDDASASKIDNDLDDWIEKRGFPKPTTDAEKQVLQNQRNEQREYTRERQTKTDSSDLAKAVTDARPDTSDDDDDDLDPLERRQNLVENQLQEERTTRQQSEFYTSNKVTTEEHKAILDIYKEKTARPTTSEGKKAAFELWSKPDALIDLLDLAKARIGRGDTAAVATEAARKEREKIAKESQATSPGRGAKTPTSGDKTPEQQRLERFSDWG